MAASAELLSSSPIDHARVVEIDAEDVGTLIIPRNTEVVLLRTPLNRIRHINKVLSALNHRMPMGACLRASSHTLECRKCTLRRRFPPLIATLFILIDFLTHRVPARVPILRTFYFALTRGRRRLLSRTEVLGRIASCGFDIVEERKRAGVLHILARKHDHAVAVNGPSYGLLFRMRRVGEGGRIIVVYKLRTMYPYAEFIQQYACALRRLDSGGKIRRDFRITEWGRLLRRCWIDELPMLINWLRGDLKLIGVRPISAHYLSLYPEAARERRSRYRPGLVPPFYADLPATFDEIVASELRYLDAYDHAPLRTDIVYFFRCVRNIVLHNARSS